MKNLYKYIAVGLVALIIFAFGFLFGTTMPVEENEIVPEVEEQDFVFVERQLEKPTTEEEANMLLEKSFVLREHAFEAYNGFIQLGYPREHPVVEFAAAEVARTEGDYRFYESIVKEYE